MGPDWLYPIFRRINWIIQCVRKVAAHVQKVLEVISMNVYTGRDPFNFVRKHFLQICVRNVALHLEKMLEVISTSVYTDNQIFVHTVASVHSDFPNARYYTGCSG
jgi:HSP90 family molecular chaperone